MELPHLGEHCSNVECNRLDFLPLKCDACESIFCTDHISYDNHSCPSAYKKDVQVPVCPLCNAPVPIDRGGSPDMAVSLHIDTDCQLDVRKNQEKIFTNKCSSKSCKIKEIIPIKCNECGKNFCLKHRHPTDHSCIGKEATRIKRLEALNRQTPNKMSKNNDTSSINILKNLQGTLDEDEALARALQASMQDKERIRRHEVQPMPSGSRDRCRLS